MEDCATRISGKLKEIVTFKYATEINVVVALFSG